LLLTLFLVQLPALLTAEDNTGGKLTVNKGASVHIGETSTLTISNLLTEADITGGGELILASEDGGFIDAHGYSIENLVLASGLAELRSVLHIEGSLTILNGLLLLNDFDLQVSYECKLNETTLQKIILNGKGRVLQEGIPVFHDAAPFVLSAPVQFDFSQIPAFTVSDSREADENIFYYTIYFFPERTNDVPVPPPKA
jgi:hypothetical protein